MKKITPHLFVFLSFIVLVYLGTWQLQRRQEKQVTLAKIEHNLNASPLTPATYENIKDNEFRKMTITGKFEHQNEFLLLNKTFNNRAGQHVITPIKASDGQVVIVDRGWISTDKEYTRPEGEVTIIGVIRSTQKLIGIAKMMALVENNPAKQTWMWLDLPVIYKNFNYPVKDYYLDLIDPNPDHAICINDNSAHNLGNSPTNPALRHTCDYKKTSYPIALPAKIEVYNEHLVYVITWYSLSIVLLLVYYFRFWRK